MSYKVSNVIIPLEQPQACGKCGAYPVYKVKEPGRQYPDLVDAQGYVHSIKHGSCSGVANPVLPATVATATQPDHQSRMLNLLESIDAKLGILIQTKS